MKLTQTHKQNQRIERISENTLVVGVDIAKNKHIARAFNYRGMELGNRCVFTNDLTGMKALLDWIGRLKDEHGLRDVLLGVEPTGHYWFPMHHYLKRQGIPVVLVNPHHVKKSKELDDNSPTKNDTKDARVVGKLVLEGRYTEPQLPEGVYAELRVLMNVREHLNKQLNRIKGKIHNWLDRYFPEYLQVFKEWEGKASLLTLRQFPLPQDVVDAGEERIVAAWKQEVQRAVGPKRARLLVQTAKDSIGLQEGLQAARCELSMLLEQYDLLTRQMEELMEQVAKALDTIPGAQAILSMPCMGVATVAGIYAEIGDLHGYRHPQQIIRHAGLNLKENSSGLHQGRTLISKRGRSRLRRNLYQATLILVARDPALKALHNYFTTRRENPLKKKQSLIALCGKWVRILFKLGTKEKHYDPSKVLGAYREAQLQTA